MGLRLGLTILLGVGWVSYVTAQQPSLPEIKLSGSFEKQGGIHGYPSHVRVGRSSDSGHFGQEQ